MAGARWISASVGWAAIAVIPWSSTAAPANLVPQDPVAFTMSVPAGVDATSVAVTVSPDPQAEDALKDGESIDLMPLVKGVELGLDRTLTVRVDPADLPGAFVGPDGVSTFEVVALGVDGTSTWTKTVSPQAVLTPDGVAWTAPEDVQPEAAPSDARRQANDETLEHVHGPVETVNGGALIRLDVPANKAIRVTASARTALVAGGNCVGPQPRKTRVSHKVVWSTLGTTYPTGGSAATMQVDSSHGATYGIGASASGDYGSWKASGSRTISGSWGFKWTGSSTSRSYRKQVEYRKYKYEHLDSRCNYYKWQPQEETGGTYEVQGIVRPDFWKCVPESSGDWYRDRSDGKSYQLSTAVKFAEAIGLELSINRQYYKSQALKYHIVGAHHYLCGSGNDYPSVAGKLMERVID